MTFTLRAGAYEYRPLRYRRKRPMRGWDVFALQTALQGAGFELPIHGADGYFGTETRAAVRGYQAERGLVADGIAGIASQRALGHELALAAAAEHRLPAGVPLGHVEKESGFQLGNYTAPYANGSRDCGVVQRNTRYALVEDAFNTPASIDTCARTVATKWAAYQALGRVTERRALELACGSWNAPAWTDQLARGGTLSSSQSEWIEAYIDRVTVYL